MRVFDPADLAIATIWGEARGEPVEGQVAVGEVIRSRMARKVMSDGTVLGTVWRPRQFSCWDDPNRLAIGALDRLDPSWLACARAWEESQAGLVVPNATHYVNVDLLGGRAPLWTARMTTVATIGRHTFYGA